VYIDMKRIGFFACRSEPHRHDDPALSASIRMTPGPSSRLGHMYAAADAHGDRIQAVIARAPTLCGGKICEHDIVACS